MSVQCGGCRARVATWQAFMCSVRDGTVESGDEFSQALAVFKGFAEGARAEGVGQRCVGCSGRYVGGGERATQKALESDVGGQVGVDAESNRVFEPILDNGVGSGCGSSDAVRSALGGSEVHGGSDNARERVTVVSNAEEKCIGVVTHQLLGPAGGVSFGRGTNYVRNQLKREKKKAEKKCRGEVPKWRRKQPVEVVSSDSGYSSVGVAHGRCETVCSDVLSTAQLKAQETLALRRVAENEVAIAKAKALCASYADEAKCEAIQELAALRIAQRANEARARSQSSWKKCEESLGSLGSTGSAGEFWMKKEIEKGRKLEKRYQQLKKQSEYMYANVTQQVRDELLAMDGTVSDEDDDCAEGLEDLDEYLAQKVEAGGKSLAAMEEEFRNFKF